MHEYHPTSAEDVRRFDRERRVWSIALASSAAVLVAAFAAFAISIL